MEQLQQLKVSEYETEKIGGQHHQPGIPHLWFAISFKPLTKQQKKRFSLPVESLNGFIIIRKENILNIKECRGRSASNNLNGFIITAIKDLTKNPVTNHF